MYYLAVKWESLWPGRHVENQSFTEAITTSMMGDKIHSLQSFLVQNSLFVFPMFPYWASA